jgi:hypothetical protein
MVPNNKPADSIYTRWGQAERDAGTLHSEIAVAPRTKPSIPSVAPPGCPNPAIAARPRRSASAPRCQACHLLGDVGNRPVCQVPSPAGHTVDAAMATAASAFPQPQIYRLSVSDRPG